MTVKRCILDMTFGSGGHSGLLLDAAVAHNIGLSIVAADRDRNAAQAAKVMATRYTKSSLLPIHSR